MHENPRKQSSWLFRGSWVLFVLALMLPIAPDGILGFPGAGAVVFFYVPFGAFVAWITFLFGGFQLSTLWWASLLSVVTVMNGFFIFAPCLRELMEERAGLVSVMLGLAIVMVVALGGMVTEWEPLPWIHVGVLWGPLAWITSFALMSANYAANHFAGVRISSSTSAINHDRSL